MARWAALAILLLALPASGADSAEVIAARAAYNRGVAAFDAKDFAAAARAFAEADAIVRNDVALGAGIDAAARADDPVLVMQLVERAEGRNVPAADARAKFGARVGRVRVTCTTCSALLDGTALPIGKPRIVSLGHHALVLTSGTFSDARDVEVGPATTEIAWAPPVARPVEPVARVAPSGISPTWFFLGVGATALLAGATTWSALSVQRDHAEFEDRCRSPMSGCSDLARSGLSAERRTNILLAASIVAAGATVIVGVFAVRWSVARADGGAVASVAVTF